MLLKYDENVKTKIVIKTLKIDTKIIIKKPHFFFSHRRCSIFVGFLGLVRSIIIECFIIYY